MQFVCSSHFLISVNLVLPVLPFLFFFMSSFFLVIIVSSACTSSISYFLCLFHAEKSLMRKAA